MWQTSPSWIKEVSVELRLLVGLNDASGKHQLEITLTSTIEEGKFMYLQIVGDCERFVADLHLQQICALNWVVDNSNYYKYVPYIVSLHGGTQNHPDMCTHNCATNLQWANLSRYTARQAGPKLVEHKRPQKVHYPLLMKDWGHNADKHSKKSRLHQYVD